MASTEPQIGEVRLKNVRLSFAEIWTPKLFGKKGAAAATPAEGSKDTNKPRYSCSFLMGKEDEQGQANIKAVSDAIMAVVTAKWPDKAKRPKFKADKICLRDGDEEDWEGYAGHKYVSAARPGEGTPPVIVDRDPKVKLTKADGRPYSGCYVNAVIRVYVQDNEFGRRINASLEAIQFLRNGDAFGAKPVNATEVFDEIEFDDADFVSETPDDTDDLLG